MKISVCMATYNGEKYIKRQIDGVLYQLGKVEEAELIISDDQSTDKTREIVESYNDPRIKLVVHEKRQHKEKYNLAHIYCSENFENAIKHASGDVIILCDQDDVWLPGRVDKMMEALKEYDCVLCNFNVANSDGVVVREGCCNMENPIRKTFLKNLIAMPFFGSAMAFNRNILELALPFPKHTVAHDNWIGLLALTVGKVGYIYEPLHNYRRHESNVTRIVKNPLYHKLMYRWRIVWNIFLRKYFR